MQAGYDSKLSNIQTSQQTSPENLQIVATQQATQGNNIVGVHYKVVRKIGEGSFGVIYEGATT